MLIGGGFNFGVAWDEEEHFAITTTLSVGFGVEASVDTPLTISYSKIENKNLSDLKGFGPYKFSTDKSANAGMFIGGFSYDFEEQKITEYDILSVGGGVDASLTIYFDFQEATKIINDLSAEAKEYVYTALENTSFPEKIQPYVDELLKRF